jgi:xanthine dehydrogenase YagR molybdenum-binding subunit
MANTPDYSWPPIEKRKVIGQRYKRVDGPAKASGRAKYGSDYLSRDLLFGAYHTCPHAHARVLSVDTSEAEKIKGVMAVHVVSPAGTEIQWAGTEIAAVAATSMETAGDAVRKIKVEYEVLPHLVDETDLRKAGSRAKAAGEKITGDPDKAFQEAEVTSEGHYGIPVINHVCLETHGSVTQWKGEGDNSRIDCWVSTQDVTHYAGSLAPNLKVPATNIHVKQDHVGGGFGSKFSPDSWGEVAARLSQKAGGRPVKLFLDRATDQKIAGNRPSAYGRIKIGGQKDGTITAWESETWGTGGFSGVGAPPLPYIIASIPNQRINHTAVSTNIGPSRAWRAPNNQQASYLTCGAVEDFAAKAGLDPLEVFKINARYTPQARRDTYLFHFDKAAELADWKKLWHPRGQSGSGPVQRGLGIGFNAWAGMGHQGQCRVTIHADGSVNVDIGTQDLGTGTRTIITQVAAETLGVPLSTIKLAIGSNDLPPDSASGGSTTVGGVSSSTRKASMNALAKLYEIVAEPLGAEADQLEAVDSHIRVKGAPNKSVTWQAACRKIPASGVISEMGASDPRNPMGLMAGGVAGVQIADVSVDTETGVVKVNRYVAVQDCGLIINPRLAESVCYGAISQGISTALFEQRFMDDQTGVMLNPNIEFYKLAGIADIGEIVVHLDIRPENDKRGVVGLGEPPAIAICAAIGNAVANAIGVRVPHIPMTPQHVLAALEGRIV